MRKNILVLIVALFASTQLWAQSEVDGIWNFTMTSPMGSVNAKVVMITDGSSLTGEFDLGEGRKWPIQGGSVNGNNVNFSITRDGAAMTYVMSGTVDGDAAKGVANAMGSTVEWSMTRAD
ncbi:MAG: hypothetical protein Q8L06_01560 [Pseudohongiella sp.]|nr:hypothetical protein [Pseudohongiella sp.]